MRNAIVTGFLVLLTAAFAPPVDGNKLINIAGIIYTSSGSYFIEEKEDGIFLITDDGWAWKLQGDDLIQFKPGDTGAFFLDKFSDAPYILLDMNRTFYITNKGVLDELKSSTENDNKSMTIQTMRGDDHYVNRWYGSSMTQEEVKDARSEYIKNRREQERMEQAKVRTAKEAKAKAEAEARNRQEIENLRQMVEQREKVHYEKCIQRCEFKKDECTGDCVSFLDGDLLCDDDCYYIENKCKERCR